MQHDFTSVQLNKAEGKDLQSIVDIRIMSGDFHFLNARYIANERGKCPYKVTMITLKECRRGGIIVGSLA